MKFPVKSFIEGQPKNVKELTIIKQELLVVWKVVSN